MTLLTAMDVNHQQFLVGRGHAKKSDRGHLRWKDKVSKWLPTILDSPYENVTLDDVSMHRACFDDANLHAFSPTQDQQRQLDSERAHCYWPGPPQSCRRGEIVSVITAESIDGSQGEKIGAIVLNITKDDPFTRGLRMSDYPATPDRIVHVDRIIAADGSGTSCMTKIVLCQQQVTVKLFGWVPPRDGCHPGRTRHYSRKF